MYNVIDRERARRVDGFITALLCMRHTRVDWDTGAVSLYQYFVKDIRRIIWEYCVMPVRTALKALRAEGIEKIRGILDMRAGGAQAFIQTMPLPALCYLADADRLVPLYMLEGGRLPIAHPLLAAMVPGEWRTRSALWTWITDRIAAHEMFKFAQLMGIPRACPGMLEVKIGDILEASTHCRRGWTNVKVHVSKVICDENGVPEQIITNLLFNGEENRVSPAIVPAANKQRLVLDPFGWCQVRVAHTMGDQIVDLFFKHVIKPRPAPAPRAREQSPDELPVLDAHAPRARVLPSPKRQRIVPPEQWEQRMVAQRHAHDEQKARRARKLRRLLEKK